jgi:hypothetical protein
MINFFIIKNQYSPFSPFSLSLSLFLILIYLFFNLFTTCIYTQIHLLHSSDPKHLHSNLSLSSSSSSSENQQKFSDNILRQLEIINRRLNDVDYRMDDFNSRLKLLEKSSINQQRREVVHKHNNHNPMNSFNNDLRF